MQQYKRSILIVSLVCLLVLSACIPVAASPVVINKVHHAVSLEECGFWVEIPNNYLAATCKLEVLPVNNDKVAATDQYFLTRAVDLSIISLGASVSNSLKPLRLTFNFDDVDYRRASNLDASQPVGRFRIGRWDISKQNWQELPSTIFWDGSNGRVEATSISGAGRYALLWSYAPGIQLSAIAGDNIRLMVNYEVLQPPVPPYVENGRIMVPLRFAENMGFSIKWDAVDQRIELTKAATLGTLKLWIGKDTVQKGEVSSIIENPPIIVNNYTYVPLRFVAESLGADVEWDALEKTARIQVQ